MSEWELRLENWMDVISGDGSGRFLRLSAFNIDDPAEYQITLKLPASKLDLSAALSLLADNLRKQATP